MPIPPIGCYKEIQATIQDATGNISIRTIGCKESVYLNDLVGRRTSNGVLRGDFGNSWRLNRDRPVTDLLVSRLPKTIQFQGSGRAALTDSSACRWVSIRRSSSTPASTTFSPPWPSWVPPCRPSSSASWRSCSFRSSLTGPAGSTCRPAALPRCVITPCRCWVRSRRILELDQALHLILPVMVLTIVSVAGWSRYVRASMLEVLRQDYVRTAAPKGLIERCGDHETCPAQCLDPLCHHRGLYPARHHRRRDHHRNNFLLARYGTPVFSGPG